MDKKLLISSVITLIIVFSFTFCFATDNMINDMKNTTENMGKNIKNGVEAMGNNIKTDTEKVNNNIRDMENGIYDGTQNTNNSVRNFAGTTSNNISSDINNNYYNNGYSASRTAGENTIMGMTANTWTWVIISVVSVAIVALIWAYFIQLTTERNHKNNDKNM